VLLLSAPFAAGRKDLANSSWAQKHRLVAENEKEEEEEEEQRCQSEGTHKIFQSPWAITKKIKKPVDP
jgi:hypothetical protein